jgi:hypothetical protein
MQHLATKVKGQCPECKVRLIRAESHYCDCPSCQQRFIEQRCCPHCQKMVDCIKGCGAVNYLCRQHGLISKHNIEYHYLKAD